MYTENEDGANFKLQYYTCAENYNSREIRCPEKPDQITDDN